MRFKTNSLLIMEAEEKKNRQINEMWRVKVCRTREMRRVLARGGLELRWKGGEGG